MCDWISLPTHFTQNEFICSKFIIRTYFTWHYSLIEVAKKTSDGHCKNLHTSWPLRKIRITTWETHRMPAFVCLFLGTCYRNRRRELSGWNFHGNSTFPFSTSGNSIGLMISNLREDKDVMHFAIFIVFIAPLKAEVLFILENFRTAIKSRRLSLKLFFVYRFTCSLTVRNFAAGHVHYSQ